MADTGFDDDASTARRRDRIGDIAEFTTWLQHRNMSATRMRQIVGHVRDYLHWQAHTLDGRRTSITDPGTASWCYLQHLRARRRETDELAAWAALELFAEYVRAGRPGWPKAAAGTTEASEVTVGVPAPRLGTTGTSTVWTSLPATS